MNIKIALISAAHANRAESLSTELQSAVEAGEMESVDRLTEELLLLIDRAYSSSLSEESWQQMMEKIRTLDDGFKSDYLLTKLHLETMVAAGIEQAFVDVVAIVKKALTTDGVVLQLPYEENDDDV